MSKFRYSRWDGTQVGFDLDADALLEEMTDDLLYHGDLNAALRRMMQQGFQDREGRDIQGMREMLEKLRERRREQLDRYDLGGVYEEIAERLDEIVEQEREGIDRRLDDARQSGDKRREELARRARAAAARTARAAAARSRRARAASCSSTTGWTTRPASSSRSSWTSCASSCSTRCSTSCSRACRRCRPSSSQRMKDMLAELNQMLEQRERGEEPDFDGFMERYGDFFPDNPQTLDELLEQMARSMAQMQQLLNSMTPEQRAQLQELANSLLDDMDLRWQVDQLGQNLRNAFPQMGWGQRMPFRGDEPMPLGQMSSVLDQLGDIDALEHLLRNATNPGQLAEVDLDQVRELLGDDAARSLDQLAKLAKELEEAGLIEQREGRMELTPKGIRRIGQRALGDLFRRLMQDRAGRHEIERSGLGHERADEHKPYEFGDPFHLDVGRTIRNAITRQGAGTPVRIRPDDFEIERTEQLTSTATVLMLDVSLSMEMRGRFLAAKKVAMALHALITSQYPRDYLGMVSFGRVAREVKPERLPEATWDFEWGTNMQHAMMLARRLLANKSGRKQIIMITDGEPTAHIQPNGDPFFDYPPSPLTIEMTLREVQRCTKAGIRINTFMLEDNYYLREFVERMMHMNRGRAFFTTPETLGDYVLVDFMEQRREQRRAGLGLGSSTAGVQPPMKLLVGHGGPAGRCRHGGGPTCWLRACSWCNPEKPWPTRPCARCAAPGGSRSSLPTATPRCGSRSPILRRRSWWT